MKKIYFIATLVCLILLLFPGNSVAQTQVIIADEDSYNLKGGLAFGSNFTVSVFSIAFTPEEQFRVQVTDNSPIEEEWWRPIFQFNLDGVTEPVENAVFRVFYSNLAPTAPVAEFTTHLYGSAINRASSIPPTSTTLAIREYDDTFNGNNSYQFLTGAFITPEDEPGQFIEFNVTDFINARINSALSTGNTWVFFRLQPDTFEVGTEFRTLKNISSQFNVGFRPKLVLNEQPGDDGPVEQVIENPEGWRLLSSPVANATISDLLDGIWTQGFDGADSEAGASNVFLYNEGDGASDASSRGYISVVSGENAPAAGQGFAAYVYEDDNPFEEGINGGFPKFLLIDGDVHSGTINMPVSLSLSDGTYTESEDGWNLVGNPFPFDINWDIETGWDKEGIDNIFYIYDPSAGDFLSWNGTTGTLPNGLIAPWQGFWVKANNMATPSLSINQSAEDDGAVFYRDFAEHAEIRLNLTQGDKYSKTIFYFNEEAVPGADRYSAFKLMPLSSAHLSLFTISANGDAFDIHSLPTELSVPVEVAIGISSTHNRNQEPLTLSWEPLNLPAGLMAELHNLRTGEVISLMKPGSYTFNAEVIKGMAVKPEADNDLAKHTKMVADQASELVIHIWDEQPTGIDNQETPATIVLHQNYPNPFNPVTLISFDTTEQTEVRLEVYNMLGQRIAVLADGPLAPGSHTVNFDGSGLNSGMYMYRLRAGNQTITRKMMLLK
ncbi:MAG: T9SS type A sorting domain-containing protein [Balneolia bacterium]|nr:T9SS type A sorting domain-containing protein [Balneolia bacterium]